jgi:hypothetical protein
MGSIRQSIKGGFDNLLVHTAQILQKGSTVEHVYDVTVQIGDDTVQFSSELIHAQVINGKHCIQVKVPQENIHSYQAAKQPANCPHSHPFTYCETCPVNPCPIGLGNDDAQAPQPSPNAAANE